MKCDCEKGGHHFHRCTKCGDLTAGYKYEKEWVCYICIKNKGLDFFNKSQDNGAKLFLGTERSKKKL